MSKQEKIKIIKCPHCGEMIQVTEVTAERATGSDYTKVEKAYSD